MLFRSIESNWGGVGITRLPRLHAGETALGFWIAQTQARVARGMAALKPGEQVLVISEDPLERARLAELARTTGLKLSTLGATALVLQP